MLNRNQGLLLKQVQLATGRPPSTGMKPTSGSLFLVITTFENNTDLNSSNFNTSTEMNANIIEYKT